MQSTEAGFWIVGIWKAFGDNAAPSGFFSFFAGTVTIPVEPCLLIGKSGFDFGLNFIEAQVTTKLSTYLPISLGLTNLMDPKQWPGQKKPGTHYSTQVKDTERAAFSLAFANSCPGVT